MAGPTYGPVFSASKPPPAAFGGPYGSTTGAVKTGPVLKATKAPVKVTVHPDGKVEVHHNPDPAPVAASKPATKAAPKPVVKAAPKPVVKAPQTIEQQAQGLLDPVKTAILDAINTRVGAEQGAITSYSKDLAGLMGSYAPASRASYGNAEVGQAAVDAATGATLQGQGQAGQAELAAKLAEINADPGTTARLNTEAGANVTGAVGALAGRGSSSLSDLISRSASAQDYGAKMPGVAGLYGLQATKSAQARATTDTANAVSTLEQQYPGLVQQIRASNDRSSQLKLEQQLAQKQYGLKVNQANTTAAYDQRKLSIAQQNANANTSRANTAQAKAAKATLPKQLSTSDKRAALKAADLYFYGQHPTLAKDGKTELKAGIPGISYGQAIRQLKVGYGLTQAQAIQLANTYYKVPGERGRPYASPQAKFTATRSQVPKVGTTMKQADGTYVFNGKIWVKK